MILHRYFARRFALTVLAVTGIFAGLMVLIDLVEQVRRFSDEDASLATLIGLSLLNLPRTLATILPLIVILATLALFLNLARTSELVVARAAGRSALRSLTGPVIVAILIGLAATTILGPIAAATSARYDLLVERLSGDGRSALSLSQEGLWLRQGDETGQTVIRADRAGAEGRELYGATFLGFTAGGGPAFRIEAETARLGAAGWTLIDAKEWRFDGPNPEQGARLHGEMTLPTSLTASEILDSFADPAAIPIWQLPRFVERLEQAGFSATRHRVWLQRELAAPLTLVAMVLIGAGFTMRHTRFGRTGVMVLSALGLGFALFFLGDFARVLGETGQIHPALAAWGPPAAAILMALSLLLHWEDG